MPFGQSNRPRKRFTGIKAFTDKIAPIYGDDKARAIATAVVRRRQAPRKRPPDVIWEPPQPSSQERSLTSTTIEELRVMHFQSGRSDKVWGGAVVRRDDIAKQAFRYIAFWGRRMSAVNVRPFDWTSRSEAYRQWQRKCEEKEGEGYKRVEWSDARYGVAETVRELGQNIGGSVPVPAPPPPRPAPQTRPVLRPKPQAEPEPEPQPARPHMRGRRDIKLD